MRPARPAGSAGWSRAPAASSGRRRRPPRWSRSRRSARMPAAPGGRGAHTDATGAGASAPPAAASQCPGPRARDPAERRRRRPPACRAGSCGRRLAAPPGAAAGSPPVRHRPRRLPPAHHGEHEQGHEPRRPGRDQAPPAVNALPRVVASTPERLFIHGRKSRGKGASRPSRRPRGRAGLARWQRERHAAGEADRARQVARVICRSVDLRQVEPDPVARLEPPVVAVEGQLEHARRGIGIRTRVLEPVGAARDQELLAAVGRDVEQSRVQRGRRGAREHVGDRDRAEADEGARRGQRQRVCGVAAPPGPSEWRQGSPGWTIGPAMASVATPFWSTAPSGFTVAPPG